MVNNEDVATAVNNIFDYSNIIVNVDILSYMVQYLDNVYLQFQKLLEDDEKKNTRLKSEFKNFEYKKTYDDGFEVKIKQKNHYNYVLCKNYSSFMNSVSQGVLNNVESVEIKLRLNYKRGENNINVLKKHDNIFEIYFHPYDISFKRISNYNEQIMNQVEENINIIFKKFPVANSIFCTK